MIYTPIQEGGEHQHSDLTHFNVAINRHFLNYMVVFIGQLCQPNQNYTETLCLLSQLKPLLKLFSSASKAAITKNHEIFLGGPYQPNIDPLYFTLT